MPTSMKAAVVLNATAGSTGAEGSSSMVSLVRDAFKRVHVEAEIMTPLPQDFPSVIEGAAASNADVVVLGGGDGTLSGGVGAVMRGHKTLGILPLGTLNHVARHASIPMDLDEAVQNIANGHVTEVDVGEVNGRPFLNNSSIGLYPQALAQREELRHRHGGGKWLAMFNASLDVLRRFPLLDITVEVEDRAMALTTPFVFVGNNRYEMSLFSLGKRASLQGGELSMYLPRRGGRLALLRLAFRALLGRLDQDRDFHSFTLREIEIRTGHRSLKVSIDGEVVQMTPPIRYSIRPRALRLLVPKLSASPVAP